jgi:DNA replication protein DnaC
MSCDSREIPEMRCDEKSFFRYVVPKKYSQTSLEDCNKQPIQYINFAKEWSKNPTSVFMCGGYGTGKTQFAFAMIREMFRHCRKIIWPRYFTSPELDARLLKAVKSDDGDSYELHEIGTQDLLFIDDIGRETKSDRLKRQYFEILNYRYTQELPTILTSNLSLGKLGETIDDSIASRIQEWQIIEFSGPDLRRSK